MPVTFGGGITIENGGFGECASARKYPASSQRAYHFGSTAFGS
jgi:hypothetical protein